MNEIVIIGAITDNALSGPAIIMKKLYENLKNIVKVTPLFYVKGTSKIKFFFRVIRLFLKRKNLIVNVHSNGISLPFFVYNLTKIFKKNKYFLSLHGLYYKEISTKGKAEKSILRKEKKYIQNFPNIICVSELLKEQIKLEFGRTNSVFVVENGIDTKKLLDHKTKNLKHVRHGEIKLVSLGGIRTIKGVWESIDLVKHLLNNGIIIHLDIYGNIDSDELYQNFITEIQNVKDYVSYKGLVKNKDDLYSIMSRYDFQLCLSQWDTFNVAIIESIGLNLPCIASDMCGASVFIKDKKMGLVVNLREKEFKSKIVKYIQEYGELDFDNYQVTSDVIIEQFSWGNIVSKYLKTIGVKYESRSY